MKRYDMLTVRSAPPGQPPKPLPPLPLESATGRWVEFAEAEAAIKAAIAWTRMEERAAIMALRVALDRLIAAAQPFTSRDIVDETSGTIPLMEELAAAIEAARKGKA